MSEFKLGLILPPIIDKRTIRLSSILRPKLLPPLPDTYDVDEALGGIDDDRMFNNSQYGDCVIAARAHQTFRFERFEQGKQIGITDKEVVDQYFKESGGVDRGLYLLQSLKCWRKEGWPVGGRNYTIYAFASVNKLDHDEVKHCIHLLGGVNFGMMVFERDMEQFKNGEPWHLQPYSGAFLGGHGVYIYKYDDSDGLSFIDPIRDDSKAPGSAWVRLPRVNKVISYNDNGLWCMTWGKRQFMTWDFWNARVSEAYGIVDNRNDWMGKDSPVDVKKLDNYLQEITGESQKEISCPVARAIIKGIKWIRRKKL